MEVGKGREQERKLCLHGSRQGAWARLHGRRR